MDLLLATTLRALMVKKTWVQFQHLLTEDSFPNTNAATIYILLEGLHKTGKRSITEATLRLAMEAGTRAKARRVELTQVIDSIMEVSTRELRNAEASIRRYIARGYCDQAVQHCLTRGGDPNFDFSVPAALMARADSVVHVADIPTVGARKVGLPGDADMARRVVGLGYSDELDRALLGGIGRGELGVLLAPPARGKTSYLIAAATHAAQRGEHVLYFTLEIVCRKVYLRYFQTLTHLTYPEMMEARQLVAAKREQVKGELYVSDYSMSKLTPNLVHAQIEEMRSRKVPISYVVIDYAEIMDPTGGFGRMGVNARALGDMVKDLRRVAVQFDVPILTAWQVNRGGADKYVFTETDVSECWEMVKHADIILGLNQGPMELTNNVLRLKVLKQRESPARPLVYLHSDMTRNTFRELADTEVQQHERAEAASSAPLELGGRPGLSNHGVGATSR